MERNSSHRRHGGDKYQADHGDARNPNKAASRNTDIESLASDRNVSRASGWKIGARGGREE